MADVREFFMFYYQWWVLLPFGACFGSFLNVVIYRYPLGKSVVHPPSACPYCKTEIKTYDNIPILSWFILGGKCRHCKHPYSFRYAAIEGLYALIWVIAPLLFPTTPLLGLSLAAAVTAAIPMVWLLVGHGRSPWYLLVSVAIFAGVALFASLR